MHAPGFPALSTVALAARCPRVKATRATTISERRVTHAHRHRHGDRSRLFHTSSPSAAPDPSNPTNGGKPASESISEHNADHDEPQTTSETTGGRSRKHDSTSLKTRQIRRQDSTHLPPVTLPHSWRSQNVTHFSPGSQPKLPTALMEDAKMDKVSNLYKSTKGDRGPAVNKAHATIETYFDIAINVLLAKEAEIMLDFLDRPLEGPSAWNSPSKISEFVRTWDMIIDASWHLTDALYPARLPEYTYKVRPFWWWHFYKDLNRRTQEFRQRHVGPLRPIRDQLSYATRLEYPLPHALADFPFETFESVSKSIGRDLKMSAPTSFDPKTGQRPIHVVAMSGYSGKSIAEALGQHVAWDNGANVVHVDAYDLSALIGDYIGQTLAYSRGNLSTLGFRAAEVNGKIEKDAESPPKQSEDDVSDGTSIISVRTSSTSIEDELQKIRQGNFDIFSKWDKLKIDKVLSHIINASEKETGTVDPTSATVIHVHDYVELNMTIEGSFILSRLRALVDAAWKRGRRVTVFGTSSCSHPSDDFQTTIREMGTLDFVVTRHIHPSRAEKETGVARRGDPLETSDTTPHLIPFNLERIDTFVENGANVNRMLCALDSKFSEESWTPLTAQHNFLMMAGFSGPHNTLRQTILPLPEVYHLALAFREAELEKPRLGVTNFVERFVMGPLRQPPGQDFLEEKHVENFPDPEDSPKKKSGDETKSESRNGLKLTGLNEYEKRIANGYIDREKVRTTFADVHAPTDTVSALKLLTSLALVRPDAFSYGVLAHDKITGCLLYGPPGTGKTMLAKAVAHDSGAHMLEISGASINDKWVGETEKLIRAVFTLAKKLSPCVVFIDEADALLANRSMMSQRSSHREQINQFLKEWDGVEETNAFIMVATNRPFDLDDAVLRRLPRKILVDLPLKDDRLAILRLLLKDEKLEPDVSMEEYAERTPYYSGSDLKSVCVAAAMAAVEEENAAATAHTGAEPFKYPERRILRREHFERALKQIPASISEDMPSLRMIRKFDEEYGNSRRADKKKGMGFGAVAPEKLVDALAGRVRRAGL